ncbi:MAG: hotdog domain-containing protein [Pontimonas sp.]|jgi:fluoroacetyl-CoA thioesterase
MLEDITVGTTATITKIVEEQECTVRGGYQIFSTPYLVLLLEAAAIEALAPFLPADQASVGTTVHVDHTAATLLGQTITATATVIEADRRRFVFSIDVKDDIDQVSTGTHERFVIDLGKFETKLTEKAGSVGAA